MSPARIFLVVPGFNGGAPELFDLYLGLFSLPEMASHRYLSRNAHKKSLYSNGWTQELPSVMFLLRWR